MKKISVILTTYNSAKHIEQTIESIISQQGKDIDFEIELIVIDDHSTDKTVEIIRKFPTKLIISEVNSGGPNRGRNIGIELATGDYICHSDHDDIWHHDRIMTLLPYLEKAPIVTSGFAVQDSALGEIREICLRNDRSHKEFAVNETFIGKLTKSHRAQNTYLSSIIYSNRLKYILFEEHFGKVDFDWVLRLFHNNSSIEVTKILYTRLKDGANLSLNEQYRIIDTYFSLMSIQEYYTLYPHEVSISHHRIYGSMARYYYFVGNMAMARQYLKRSGLTLKTIAYYITTYMGSKLVKKYFHIYD